MAPRHDRRPNTRRLAGDHAVSSKDFDLSVRACSCQHLRFSFLRDPRRLVICNASSHGLIFSPSTNELQLQVEHKTHVAAHSSVEQSMCSNVPVVSDSSIYCIYYVYRPPTSMLSDCYYLRYYEHCDCSNLQHCLSVTCILSCDAKLPWCKRWPCCTMWCSCWTLHGHHTLWDTGAHPALCMDTI